MENTFIDIKRMEKKKVRKAASAVALLMLLFLLFCVIYDYALFFGINLAFNEDFVFKKSYMHDAAVFFNNFLPDMPMIENFTIQILSLLTSFGIVRLFYKFKPMSFLPKPDNPDRADIDNKTSLPKLIGCTFCVIISINLVTSLLIAGVTKLLEIAGLLLPEPDFTFKTNSFANLLIYFLSLCVFAPLIEEFLLRGCVIKILKPYGNWLAIFVSAFFFALLHGNIGQGFGAFFIGVILGYVAVKTNSILPTIILHSLNNFFPYMGLVVTNVKNVGVQALFIMVYIAVFTAGIAFFFIFRKKFRLNDNNTISLTRKQCFGTMFTSVFIILYLAYEIFRFVIQIVNIN